MQVPTYSAVKQEELTMLSHIAHRIRRFLHRLLTVMADASVAWTF